MRLQQDIQVTKELEFTGERFTPECMREIRYEHFHRYALAARFCSGSRVLDAACGEGYGSALLAQVAAAVSGVDIAGEVIEHARQRYASQANLDFRQADVTRLPFPDHAFDRVVSFETLEHLSEQEALLREFRRVLQPEGLLLLSSPDKAIYTDQQGNRNPFHVRELYRGELESLIAAEFPAHVLLGQKLMFHSAIWAEGAAARLELQTLKDGGGLAQGAVSGAPVYWIAVCAGTAELLPEVDGSVWLFDDEAESVYQHYYHEIRKNMAAGKLLAERDAEIESLQRQLTERRAGGWRRWFRRG